MGNKLRMVENKPLRTHELLCPACNIAHGFKVPPHKIIGELTAPTIKPDLLFIEIKPFNGSAGRPRCKFSVTDGKITFADDCTHDFRGKTVDMTDIEPS